MAQVDLFNYFSIIFWFVWFFSFFYLINYIYIIPSLYISILLRFSYFSFYYNKIKNKVIYFIKLKIYTFISSKKFNNFYTTLKLILYAYF